MPSQQERVSNLKAAFAEHNIRWPMIFAMNDQSLKILQSLEDGEWHALEHGPHLWQLVRPLLRSGLINFSSTGTESLAIATDAGLKYIKQKKPPHPTRTDP